MFSNIAAKTTLPILVSFMIFWILFCLILVLTKNNKTHKDKFLTVHLKKSGVSELIFKEILNI